MNKVRAVKQSRQSLANYELQFNLEANHRNVSTRKTMPRKEQKKLENLRKKMAKPVVISDSMVLRKQGNCDERSN